MTAWSILFDIAVSIAASWFFWLLSFVITHTHVVFSDRIEKKRLPEDGRGIRYRIRLSNIGRRDLMEATLTAKITVRLQDGTTNSTYLGVGEEQTIPVLEGRSRKRAKRYKTYLYGLYIRGVAMTEYAKEIYPRQISEKARAGTLSLDDIFAEFRDSVQVTVYVAGNDRVTGARKMFISPAYGSGDVVCGRFHPFSGIPRTLRALLHRKRLVVAAISEIDDAGKPEN